MITRFAAVLVQAVLIAAVVGTIVATAHSALKPILQLTVLP